MGPVELNKTPGWQGRLTVYIDGLRGQPFRWGRLDCGLFAAGAVEAMTGVNPLPGGLSYRSQADARRQLAALGFADHIALAASLFVEIGPHEAQPGDIAVVPGPALGIVQGASVYAMGPGGLGRVPFHQIERAFSIP